MQTLLLAWMLALATAGAPPDPEDTQEVQAPPAAEEPAPEEPAAEEPDAPTELVLDPAGTSIYALLYKTGAAGAVAHDHVVEARDYRGTARIVADDPARSQVSIVVSVTGLFPDADEMRAKVGLPNQLSDGQRSEILSHIVSEFQLFAERYDTIRFTSTAITGTLPDVEVTGDFTLRGVTRSITVPMEITPLQGGGYRARGSFRVLQTDYGYKPYSALFGAIRNKDEVDVVIDARLVPVR